MLEAKNDQKHDWYESLSCIDVLCPRTYVYEYIWLNSLNKQCLKIGSTKKSDIFYRWATKCACYTCDYICRSCRRKYVRRPPVNTEFKMYERGTILFTLRRNKTDYVLWCFATLITLEPSFLFKEVPPLYNHHSVLYALWNPRPSIQLHRSAKFQTIHVKTPIEDTIIWTLVLKVENKRCVIESIHLFRCFCFMAA